MKMKKTHHRLDVIADFVYTHLNEMSRKKRDDRFDFPYRWEHTLRVANYGKIIAEAEGAQVEIVIAACLLHDVALFDTKDYKEHGRLSAKVARPLLQELGYLPDEIDNICYSIAVHVDGGADFPHPRTLESKIVTDADSIDRFGALRTVHACIPEMSDFKNLVQVLKERIPQLEKIQEEETIETQTGREIFTEQLNQQIGFYKALIKEGELTQVPVLK